MKSALTILALTTLIAQFSTRLHAQGSLTPPAGPPAPVMKTLDQVEARIAVTAETCPASAEALHVINQAGSYYLTGNIIAPSGKACIKLNAQGITLDLNGYSITGSVGSTKGIIAGSIGGPVVIKNGFLRFCQQQAIHFTQASDFTIQDIAIYGSLGRGIEALGRGTIERVTVKGAVGQGIYCEGDGQVTVRDCRVESVNGTAGIHATKALITGCSVAGVTATGGGETAGIYALYGNVCSCTVRSITHNGGNRVSGIQSADRVSDCNVSGVTANGGTETTMEANGIVFCGAVSRCSVKDINGAENHQAYGIGQSRSADHCWVLEVSGTGTHAGIQVARASNCTVDVVTAGTGIKASSVSGCTVNACDRGIVLEEYGGTGNLATGGLAKDNFVDDCESMGIVVFCENATVNGNTVNGGFSADIQGSIGIYAPGVVGIMRIEGNTVSRWDKGISATSARALVVRNSSGANTTNYTIHASMPVVSVGSLGTNPNANVSQ